MEATQMKQMQQSLKVMFAAYSIEPTADMIRGYLLGLGDLTAQEVQTATVAAIRLSDRLPRPVDLRRLLGERTGAQRALIAWADFLKAVPLGPYRHIDFADQLINAVIRSLGGWPNAVSRCGDVEGEKWLRVEFLRCYEAMETAHPSDEALAALPGLSNGSAKDGKVTGPITTKIACVNHPVVARLETKPEKQAGLPAGITIPRLRRA